MIKPDYRKYEAGFQTGHTASAINEVSEYFCRLHDSMGQKYDGQPYSFHLKLVDAQRKRFEKLIPVDAEIYAAVLFGIYGHDAMEDCNLTFNDVTWMVGRRAADIIYACTEDRGRNRNERKSPRWYSELNENEYAVFVKLCDIIANSLYSHMTNSSMFDKYKGEYFKKVKPALYETHREQYGEMFDFLEKIYSL